MSNAQQMTAAPTRSVLADMAGRYGMEREAFEATLRATVVPKETTREQFAAFLLVAKEYNLNPLTKQIYAFPGKGGGIQPIVSIDGWLHMAHQHPQFDGITHDDIMANGELVAITCHVHRKDLSRPISATEYMSECKRGTEVWKQWPARMLRHKATIQAIRYAFGYSGVVDDDEYDRMQDVTHTATVVERAPVTSQIKRKSAAAPEPEVIERGTSDGSALEALLQWLKAATDDQQVDVLCSEASEALGDGSSAFTAFCQAASVRLAELNREGGAA